MQETTAAKLLRAQRIYFQKRQDISAQQEGQLGGLEEAVFFNQEIKRLCEELGYPEFDQGVDQTPLPTLRLGKDSINPEDVLNLPKHRELTASNIEWVYPRTILLILLTEAEFRACLKQHKCRNYVTVLNIGGVWGVLHFDIGRRKITAYSKPHQGLATLTQRFLEQALDLDPSGFNLQFDPLNGQTDSVHIVRVLYSCCKALSTGYKVRQILSKLPTNQSFRVRLYFTYLVACSCAEDPSLSPAALLSFLLQNMRFLDNSLNEYLKVRKSIHRRKREAVDSWFRELKSTLLPQPQSRWKWALGLAVTVVAVAVLFRRMRK